MLSNYPRKPPPRETSRRERFLFAFFWWFFGALWVGIVVAVAAGVFFGASFLRD